MSTNDCNINYIFQVDDMIPNWLLDHWEDILVNSDRWKYGLRGSPADVQKFFAIWISRPGEIPFINDISEIGRTFHEMWKREGLNSIIPDARIDKIHRCHVNGTISSPHFLSIHQDWNPPNFWTLLFYVSGEDGDTIFFNEPDINKNETAFKEVHRIKFKRGRIAFFPSHYWHVGELPSAGFRTSLSLNYVLNDCQINLDIQKTRGITNRNLPDPDISDFLNEVDRTSKYVNAHKEMQDALLNKHN